MKRKHMGKSPLYVSPHEDISDISDIEDSYITKVESLKSQLEKLNNKTHTDLVKVREEVELWFTEQKQRIQILHEHKVDIIHREYAKEAEACDRDCEHEKKRIQAYLVSLCEELKRRLEHDKKNIELTPSGDILEFKPAVTRKLRRRTGGDLTTSNPNNFMYWGDILLCGNRWQFTHQTVNTKSTTTESNSNHFSDSRSPLTNNTIDNQNLLTTSTDDPSTKTSLDPNDKSHSQTGINFQSSNYPGNRLTTSSSGNFNSNRGNLFGSLGLNLFDGSLLSHLLASMNSNTNNINNELLLLSSSSSASHSYANCNAQTNGGLLFNGLTALLNNSPSAGSAAAAAVAAGLIIPACGGGVASSGGVGLVNGSNLTPSLNGLVPQPTTVRKRRQQNTTPAAHLNLLLPEHDIYADLTIIHRACNKASNAGPGACGSSGGIRKQSNQQSVTSQSNHLSNNQSSPNISCLDDASANNSSRVVHSLRDLRNNDTNSNSMFSGMGSPNSFHGDSISSGSCGSGTRATHGGLGKSSSGSTFSVWIDDGRLYCGQKCFQIGACVILEGRDGSSHRCTGTIVSIGAQDVAIRRSSDHGICRVTVQQLKHGRYALWPNNNSKPN